MLSSISGMPSQPRSTVESKKSTARVSAGSAKRITAKDIPNIYPVGSDVIVQVTKGPIGTKGPRVTTNLSFAGRYLVLMPFSDRSGISRKIEDPKERERLSKILRELDIPDGIGVIIRTVGEGQRARYFVRDLRFLLDQWRKVEQEITNHPAPHRVFEEPDLVERTVRDFLTEEIDEVVCDDQAALDRMGRWSARFPGAPATACIITMAQRQFLKPSACKNKSMTPFIARFG